MTRTTPSLVDGAMAELACAEWDHARQAGAANWGLKEIPTKLHQSACAEWDRARQVGAANWHPASPIMFGRVRWWSTIVVNMSLYCMCRPLGPGLWNGNHLRLTSQAQSQRVLLVRRKCMRNDDTSRPCRHHYILRVSFTMVLHRGFARCICWVHGGACPRNSVVTIAIIVESGCLQEMNVVIWKSRVDTNMQCWCRRWRDSWEKWSRWLPTFVESILTLAIFLLISVRWRIVLLFGFTPIMCRGEILSSWVKKTPF